MELGTLKRPNLRRSLIRKKVKECDSSTIVQSTQTECSFIRLQGLEEIRPTLLHVCLISCVLFVKLPVNKYVLLVLDILYVWIGIWPCGSTSRDRLWSDAIGRHKEYWEHLFTGNRGTIISHSFTFIFLFFHIQSCVILTNT